jgi:hypothetical protein
MDRIGIGEGWERDGRGIGYILYIRSGYILYVRPGYILYIRPGYILYFRTG